MLRNSLEILETEFQLHPVFAVELEFYVGLDLPEETILQKMDELASNCHPAEKERGKSQYEIATLPTSDIDGFIKQTEALRVTISENLQADFSAKPDADDYGSAMHFHLHLEDKAGCNIFTREAEGEYSEPLLHSLGGLLAAMKQNLAIFSPHDRSRFEAYGMHSPTHLCWGPNNRSVALRLPTKPYDNKHIEHRVSAADADIRACVDAILQGVIYGLKNRINPGEPIYGNAWDAQYGLEKLVN